MKPIIFLYGALAGTVIISTSILTIALAGETHLAGAQWLGYLVMIVALSLIFVGIKRYRDQELGGVIRFGTGVLLGLGITLVASVIYVAAWEVYLAMTDYAFIDDYAQSMLSSEEAADAARRYANPAFRLPVTFLEIFPVGLLVTLASAGLLKRGATAP